MARRFSRGQTYPTTEMPEANLVLIGTENGEKPKPLSPRWTRSLRSLGPVGLGLYRARAAREKAEKREMRFKEQIVLKLDQLPELSGAIIKGGPAGSVKVQRVAVMSRQVVDNLGLLGWLGKDAGDVVTGVNLPIAELVADPERFASLVSIIANLYSPELASEVRLEIGIGKLNDLAKRRGGHVPEEFLKDYFKHWRIDAKPVA